MSDFSVHTGSLGSSSQAIAGNAAGMESEFSWLSASEPFDDKTVERSVSDLLLSWRITTDQVIGDLYTLSGNLKAAQAAYGEADRAIHKAADEVTPPPPEGEIVA